MPSRCTRQYRIYRDISRGANIICIEIYREAPISMGSKPCWQNMYFLFQVLLQNSMIKKYHAGARMHRCMLRGACACMVRGNHAACTLWPWPRDCVRVCVCNELYLVYSRHSILVEGLNHILATAFAEREHAPLQSVPEPLGDLSGPVLFPCTHAHTSAYTVIHTQYIRSHSQTDRQADRQTDAHTHT